MASAIMPDSALSPHGSMSGKLTAGPLFMQQLARLTGVKPRGRPSKSRIISADINPVDAQRNSSNNCES